MSKTKNYTLWVLQALLAALFIFSGVIKLISPIATLTAEIPLPGTLIQFIGVCEILGGLGLVLPGVFRIAKILTPIAAIGLIIIMIGAVVISIATVGVLTALMPLVVGILCFFVAKGRSKVSN